MLSQVSNAAKEIPNGNLHYFGNAKQCFNRNDFFSPFDLADIFGVQGGGFGQLFLSKTGLFPIQANGIANDFTVPQNWLSLWICHAPKIAETSLLLTPATCWYFMLAILLKALKIAKTNFNSRVSTGTVTGV
jgi:hypothetical protein